MDGEAGIPDTRRLASLDVAFRDDEGVEGSLAEVGPCGYRIGPAVSPLRLAALGTSPHFVGLEDGRRRHRFILHPTQWGGGGVAKRRRRGGDAGGYGDDRGAAPTGGDAGWLVLYRIAGMDGEAWIPDTRRLASLDVAFRDDEGEGEAAEADRLSPGWR
ncbi:hypothetical protein [Aquibium sp. ELW1220]|uniref:hypothetical protein n=1 Tax=Aquibium sp. ELW1220 TaxID=2976766 RepID=UPI0025B05F1E|nr:hypothetical protein [Aquibium sp. ELW1220]MDN2583426.1 hypothetical protein [Aquibium sp. ELW1220]